MVTNIAHSEHNQVFGVHSSVSEIFMYAAFKSNIFGLQVASLVDAVFVG